jgi:hypothetical protein
MNIKSIVPTYDHPYAVDLSTQTQCEERWPVRIENELAELR